MKFKDVEALYTQLREVRAGHSRTYHLSERMNAVVDLPQWVVWEHHARSTRYEPHVYATPPGDGAGIIEHDLTAEEHRRMAKVIEAVDAWVAGKVDELPESGWKSW